MRGRKDSDKGRTKDRNRTRKYRTKKRPQDFSYAMSPSGNAGNGTLALPASLNQGRLEAGPFGQGPEAAKCVKSLFMKLAKKVVFYNLVAGLAAGKNVISFKKLLIAF
jgi:hypothetical protein